MVTILTQTDSSWFGGRGGVGDITQFNPFANELPITAHVAPCPFYRLRRQQF